MTDITVGDTRPVVQYTADGVQTDFTFDFPILAEADLAVRDGTGADPGGYSVTGVGQSSGGTVSFASPPSADTRLTLYRDMPVARTGDFVEAGDFRASALNADLDRLAMMVQQVEAATARAVRQAPHDAEADLVLPDSTQRAGAVLAFDADGKAAALTDPETAAQDAAASAAAAATSETNAADSATSASNAATTAQSAANTATSEATNAGDSADAASGSAADAANSASAASGSAATAQNAADTVTSAVADERRRVDLAVQRSHLALAHPGIAVQPAWAFDGLRGLGLDALSVTRPGPGTYYDARGKLVTAGADTLRLDHDPATGEPLGALIEAERTNVLHDSFNPASQTRTLASGVHTVSMAGSGQVDISGAANGTATAGAPLTFTMGSSGNVTFTPSGEVTVFQCEAGSDATSFIETPANGGATRPGDVVSAVDIGWLAPAHATILLDVDYPDVPTDEGSRLFSLDDGGDSNRHTVFWAEWAQKLSWFTKAGGNGQGSISGLTGGWGGDGARHRIGLRLGGGERTLYVDGGEDAADSITDPTGFTMLRLGTYHQTKQQWRGHIRRAVVWNAKLADADLAAVTG